MEHLQANRALISGAGTISAMAGQARVLGC